VSGRNHHKIEAYLIPYPIESFSRPILIEDQQTFIGRDPTGSIKIAGKTVSRQHAVITCENGRFFIEDLDSQNGTFLNNKPIQKAALKSHDKIRVGNRWFLFLLQPETVDDLLIDPSFSATDTIMISNEEIKLSELWAQNTEHAARFFLQNAATEVSNKAIEPDRSDYKRLSMLYQLSDHLRTINEVAKIYEKGLDLIMESIPSANCALIVRKSDADGSYKIVASKLNGDQNTTKNEIPVSRTLFDWVLSEKITLVSQDVSKDLRFKDSDSIRIHNLRSIICVPIVGKNDVLGLLYAQSDNLIAPITKDDATFASAVANELALNIDNIRFLAKALKNERMAGVGLTIGNLAHNIKNLIALNQSASQLMDRHIAASEDDQMEKCWQWMQQSLAGINQLATDILDYVKEDQFLNRPTDINKAIMKYRHSLERRFSHEGISFDFALSAENPVWMMDEIQFQRALLNLVINAADAIKDKKRGKIRISTEVKPNRCLTVSVVDNGCGIPSSKMDKVLDLFFTTKGTKGTGLGLPMVQKFVEKSGGKLTFKSREGIGSKFQMVFFA